MAGSLAKIFKTPEKQRLRNRQYYKNLDAVGRAKYNTRKQQEYRNNPDSSESSRYKWRYGITLETKKEMFQKQNQQCAICDKSLKFIDACVDHCHATKTVRGLLCRLCNMHLAGIERPNFVVRAQTYLQEWMN